MDPTLVQVTQGKIRGKIAEDYKGAKYYSFQAIPYAQPPIGDLRFKAPQPPLSWEGVKDCTKEGSECLSKDFFNRNLVVGSEDCLHLNVYTPQMPDGRQNLKPVMFWIHGGGFTMGSSKTDMYGPDYLITEDIVVVSINYRLGIFGFLSLEDPILGVPGNNALKDMIMALKWVQKNIHYFNGDPNNVTIFGESAGGAATHLLVLSPMSKGLFHRAIIQSGSALNPWVLGTRCAKLIAKEMGFKSENEKEILHMLKKVPATDILKAQFKTYDGVEADTVRMHGPVIEYPSSEPAFLTEHPLEIMKSGKQNRVPLIIGFTNKEGMLTEMWYTGMNEELKMIRDFETKVAHQYKLPKGSELSKKVAQEIKQFYFKDKEHTKETMDNFYDMESDRFFIRGIYKTIQYQSKSAPETPIYVYRFSVDRELNFFKKLGKITTAGASHCDDLGYIFKNNLTPTPKQGTLEFQLLQRMIRLWANFARSGNPNPIIEDTLIDVRWKPVEAEQINFLDIGDKLSQGINPEKERMKFFDDLTKMVPAAKDM